MCEKQSILLQQEWNSTFLKLSLIIERATDKVLQFIYIVAEVKFQQKLL